MTTNVLTDLILAETVTRLRVRSDAARAVGFDDDALESRRYGVAFADVGPLRGALGKMKRYADKRLSLTDCVSFEVIDRLALDEWFTFDRDFRACGYRMLP